MKNVTFTSQIKWTYPKSPVAKNDDYEIDNINQEHQGIDITHRTVLRVDDVIEELPDGKVYVKATERRERVRRSE